MVIRILNELQMVSRVMISPNELAATKTNPPLYLKRMVLKGLGMPDKKSTPPGKLQRRFYKKNILKTDRSTYIDLPFITAGILIVMKVLSGKDLHCFEGQLGCECPLLCAIST